MARSRPEIALVVFSVALTLVAGEVALRMFLPIETIGRTAPFRPEVESRAWERSFFPACAPNRRPRPSDDTFDPFLGWESVGHVRSGRAYSPKKAPHSLRVLALGDSFTWGGEVLEDETFSARLEHLLPRAEVLNMGVRGYGIDQIVSKYLLHAAKVQHDVVVLSLYDGDYHRMAVSFFNHAKPVFHLDPTTGDPVAAAVPDPQAVCERLGAELGPVSYLGLLLETSVLKVWDEYLGTDRQEAYYAKWDAIGMRFLEEAKEAARAAGARILVLSVPARWAFQGPDGPARYLGSNLYHSHVRDLVKRVGIEFIDLLAELPRRLPAKEVTRAYASGGHLSPEGHWIAAEVIRDTLEVAP